MSQYQTSEQIQTQISALEFRMRLMSDNNASTKSLFAINGKIKNLRKLLEKRKQFEFLAK